ncbi:MAG: hypothetical protein ACMXYE_04300 [Candidatus Woesearchaeota archaeon]
MDELNSADIGTLESLLKGSVPHSKRVSFADKAEYENPALTFHRHVFSDYAVLSIPGVSRPSNAVISRVARDVLKGSDHFYDADTIHIYQLHPHSLTHIHPDIQAEVVWWCGIAGLGNKLRNGFGFAEPSAQGSYGFFNVPLVDNPQYHHPGALLFGQRPRVLAQAVVSIPHVHSDDERRERLGEIARDYFAGLPAVAEPQGIHVHEVHEHRHPFNGKGVEGIASSDIGIAELYSLK